MSLSLPFDVRLVTSRGDAHITQQLRSLRFRSIAVGGFADCTMALDRPLTINPEDIAYYGKVYIYRGPRVIWEGRLEDPGRSAGADGQVWNLAAVGPSAHAQDRTVPLIYADRGLSRWIRQANNSVYLTAIQDSTSASAPGYRLQFDRGTVVTVADHGGVEYAAIRDAGMKLARVSYTYAPGNNDTNWRHLLLAVNGGSTTASDIGFNSGSGTVSKVVVTDWANGRDRAQIHFQRNTSGVTITDDTTLVWLTGIAVRSLLLNADGSEKTTGYTVNTVLASDVVKDLVGRLLPKFDGANATIATTSYAIEQLAYPDGVKPSQVLSDLLVMETGYRWGAWESNSTGKHRFEFSAWPTTVRYECDVTDGYTSTGSADGLYNAARVAYMDAAGQPQTTQRTQTVAELTAAGLTREYPLDLGTRVMSLADAQRAGDQFLAEHRYPPNAGRLTIARKIFDGVRGCMVYPDEIVPGNLIRVRGVNARIDALNSSSRDGTTIFKIQSMEYDTGNAAARLELDSWSTSTTRAAAEAASSRARRR